MEIDRVERWTERAMALLNSPEGREIYVRNKYELGLDRKNNLLGIIQKATHLIKWEHLAAVYERVGAELAERKAERLAG
jgi:hypothetical protein